MFFNWLIEMNRNSYEQKRFAFYMVLYRPQQAHVDFKKKDTDLYLNPGVSKIEKVLKEF